MVRLNLNDNQLSEFRSSWFQWNNRLTCLNLGRNSITDLNVDNLQGLASLERLDIDDNDITRIKKDTFQVDGKSIIVGSLYRPPNSKEGIIVNELTELSNKIKSEKKELILGMDHNLDLLKSAEHKMTQNFLDSLLDQDIPPTITRPTRITHSTATLIDNIFVSNNLYWDFESSLILNDISDHLPVLTLLKQTKFTDKKV